MGSARGGAQTAEQAVGAQRGQTAEHAAEHPIGGGFKTGGSAVGQAEGGGAALLGARAGGADAVGRFGVDAAAPGFGGRLSIGGRGGLAGGIGLGDPARGNGLAQGGIVDPDKPCSGGDGVPLVKQALALGGCFGREHGRAAHAPGLVERSGTLRDELFAPARQRPRGDAQGLWDLAGTRVAVDHQGGQRQALPGAGPGGVGEVAVGSNKPGHLPVLGKSAHQGIDSNCPLGHSGQQELWHGAGRVSLPCKRKAFFPPRFCTMPPLWGTRNLCQIIFRPTCAISRIRRSRIRMSEIQSNAGHR